MELPEDWRAEVPAQSTVAGSISANAVSAQQSPHHPLDFRLGECSSSRESGVKATVIGYALSMSVYVRLRQRFEYP